MIKNIMLFAVVLSFLIPFVSLRAFAEADDTEWREMNRRVINLFAQGKKEEGITMMKEVIVSAEKEFGPESTIVAKSINNLGNFYFHMNQIEEAQKQYLRAIEIEKKLEKADTLIAGSYFNLAMTYATNQGAPEIQQYLDKALSHYQVNPEQNKEAIKRVKDLKEKLGQKNS